MNERKCPHRNIVDCPLYIGMHIVGGHSCWSDRLEEGLCAVDLGANYDGLIEAMRVKHPREVAECEWRSAQRESQEQRKRNMLLAGIH